MGDVNRLIQEDSESYSYGRAGGVLSDRLKKRLGEAGAGTSSISKIDAGSSVNLNSTSTLEGLPHSSSSLNLASYATNVEEAPTSPIEATSGASPASKLLRSLSSASVKAPESSSPPLLRTASARRSHSQSLSISSTASSHLVRTPSSSSSLLKSPSNTRFSSWTNATGLMHGDTTLQEEDLFGHPNEDEFDSKLRHFLSLSLHGKLC